MRKAGMICITGLFIRQNNDPPERRIRFPGRLLLLMFTSNGFILFLLISLILYYLVPVRWRWIVLLSVSWGYYAYTSLPAMAFLLFSTIVTFGAAKIISDIQKAGDAEDRKTVRKITFSPFVISMFCRRAFSGAAHPRSANYIDDPRYMNFRHFLSTLNFLYL